MKALTQYSVGLGVIVIGMVLLASPFAATGRSEEPSRDWPRQLGSAPLRITLYEPQVMSYTDDTMKARAAVSAVAGDGEPVFGAVWFALELQVDREQRTAVVTGFQTDTVRLPTAPSADVAQVQRLLAEGMTGATLSLDPLLLSLEHETSAKQAAESGRDAVPDILYTPYPVALVRIDGEPELSAIANSDLVRVTNTDSFLVMQKGTGRWFLRLGGQWLSAPAYTGAWSDTKDVPASVLQAATAAGLSQEPVVGTPRLVVASRPTEVITTHGEPVYAVIAGANLLYVSNTDTDLFLEISGQKHYALLAGRWFVTTSLVAGPWAAVPADQLPAAFRDIPADSPKHGVLAHVAGTKPALEAVRAAQTPVVQSVQRGTAPITIEYQGEPEFAQIGDGPVYFATNASSSVLRVGALYYLCSEGVWYEGATAYGPWSVCVSVPPAVYTIPPTCPVYPVSYVRVYDYSPDYAYVGYTYGYLGWYSDWDDRCLVYGFAPYCRPWPYSHFPWFRYPIGIGYWGYRSCWPRYGFAGSRPGWGAHHGPFVQPDRCARPALLPVASHRFGDWGSRPGGSPGHWSGFGTGTGDRSHPRSGTGRESRRWTPDGSRRSASGPGPDRAALSQSHERPRRDAVRPESRAAAPAAVSRSPRPDRPSIRSAPDAAPRERTQAPRLSAGSASGRPHGVRPSGSNGGASRSSGAMRSGGGGTRSSGAMRTGGGGTRSSGAMRSSGGGTRSGGAMRNGGSSAYGGRRR